MIKITRIGFDSLHIFDKDRSVEFRLVEACQVMLRHGFFGEPMMMVITR